MTIQGESTNPELSVELIWVFVANIKVFEFAWFYCLFKFASFVALVALERSLPSVLLHMLPQISQIRGHEHCQAK